MTTLLDEPTGQMVAMPGGLELRTDPGNPLAMLADQLERGVDPDKLGKLMDLADRYRIQQAESAFAGAMMAAQSEMPVVVRDGFNSHTKSKYAKLETVNAVVKPVYVRHGFSLSFGTATTDLAEHVRIVCDASHVGGHTRRYHLDLPLDGAGFKGTSNKTPVQATGSTLHYGQRYLTLMIFNVVVADQDLDGQAAESLDCISDRDVLDLEDLIRDKAVNLPRFLDWLREGGMCVGEPSLKSIASRHFAKVLKTLQLKKAPGER